jgi:hypothetical protein
VIPLLLPFMRRVRAEATTAVGATTES